MQPPQVFAFTGIAGIVAFVLAAGCLAADAIPYRPAHAAAAALTLVDAVVLAVGGQGDRDPRDRARPPSSCCSNWHPLPMPDGSGARLDLVSDRNPSATRSPGVPGR